MTTCNRFGDQPRYLMNNEAAAWCGLPVSVVSPHLIWSGTQILRECPARNRYGLRCSGKPNRDYLPWGKSPAIDAVCSQRLAQGGMSRFLAFDFGGPICIHWLAR